MERKPYPTDVSDAEWALVALYLTLMTEDAPLSIKITQGKTPQMQPKSTESNSKS